MRNYGNYSNNSAVGTSPNFLTKGEKSYEAKQNKKLQEFFTNPDYVEHVGVLKDSPLSDARVVNDYDKLALCEMLNRVDGLAPYLAQLTEGASAGDLGIIPRIGHAILTSFYGVSALPLFASFQSINEAIGSVYFQQYVSKH